jgi:membrane dipeptidase
MGSTGRRDFLRTAVSIGGCAALRPFSALAQTRPLVYADMHSHLGLLGGRAHITEAMVPHGMLVIARTIVSDGPVIQRIPGKGLQQVREPAAGELASRFDTVLARMKAQHQAENLTEITDATILKRVQAGSQPAVVLAAEGADFLEGDIKRMETARSQGLVHLQLVHYRVSDIGDISTARPAHNGLTAFGREVVAACNKLGILVDVAHCTPEGIQHAIEISTKPLIYSHGQVNSSTPHWTQSVARARAISRTQARAIAEKRGVIGIWPLGSQFGSPDSYVSALIDTAQMVGPAHVGVGTDLLGLGGSTVIHGYERFPQLEEIMAARGLKTDEIRNMLGANYLRALGDALSI